MWKLIKEKAAYENQASDTGYGEPLVYVHM
jgi:hypothetical protein